MKFKARGDLVAFATKKPGALAAHFLITIFEKLYNRLPRETRDLRRASVAAWAQKHGNLSEVRDQREVATLAHCMDLVAKRDLEELMDVMSQRVLAIQQAKAKGGSWEKAQRIELLAPEGAGAASSGMLRLLA